MAAAACIALAAATLLIPSAPTTDPWGWIVWGRELAHLQLSTAVGGAPSWKPLPVLFTTPLSAFGGAAPDLWILVARASGLLGVVAAWRLGSRLGGRYAAALAGGGLVLSEHWVRSFLHGYSEPLAIALLLLAVDRHWSERPRQALLLLGAVSLARPEALPLALAYGVLEWRRRGIGAWEVAAVALLVPSLWLVPDWVGSGDPLHAGHVAGAVDRHGALAALGGGMAIAPAPLSLAAVAGFAIARRRGDRRVVELSALAAAWAALLLALMLVGYPASGRFFVLPASLVCVLGAGGAVQAARVSSGRTRVAVLVALATLPLVAARVAASGAEAGDAVERARVEESLAKAIDRVGPRRLRACGEPVLPRGLSWMRGEVAWQLGVPLGGVRSVQTSGDRYIAALSRFGAGSIPSRVSVSARGNRYVVLDPFGSTRVRSPRVDLDVAGRSGSWRVLVPDRRACGRAPTRDV